jgi:hypothetical protein
MRSRRRSAVRAPRDSSHANAGSHSLMTLTGDSQRRRASCSRVSVRWSRMRAVNAWHSSTGSLPEAKLAS